MFAGVYVFCPRILSFRVCVGLFMVCVLFPLHLLRTNVSVSSFDAPGTRFVIAVKVDLRVYAREDLGKNSQRHDITNQLAAPGCTIT